MSLNQLPSDKYLSRGEKAFRRDESVLDDALASNIPLFFNTQFEDFVAANDFHPIIWTYNNKQILPSHQMFDKTLCRELIGIDYENVLEANYAIAYALYAANAKRFFRATDLRDDFLEDLKYRSGGLINCSNWHELLEEICQQDIRKPDGSQMHWMSQLGVFTERRRLEGRPLADDEQIQCRLLYERMGDALDYLQSDGERMGTLNYYYNECRRNLMIMIGRMSVLVFTEDEEEFEGQLTPERAAEIRSEIEFTFLKHLN